MVQRRLGEQVFVHLRRRWFLLCLPHSREYTRLGSLSSTIRTLPLTLTLFFIAHQYIPGLNDVVFLHKGISWEWAIVFICLVVFVGGIELWKWAKRVYMRRTEPESIAKQVDEELGQDDDEPPVSDAVVGEKVAGAKVPAREMASTERAKESEKVPA